MKSIAGVLCGLMLLASLSFAQMGVEGGQDENQTNYDKKLKKEFMSKVSWEKTFESAKKKASAENKLMLGYFTRSYSP